MDQTRCDGFAVVGLSARVSNGDPAGIGAAWAAFYQAGLDWRVLGADCADVHCVYHSYAGGAFDPYDMTIGYRVPVGANIPAGLASVEVPAQVVAVFEAVGEQPQALISQWQAVWQSGLERAFVADFDVYDATRPDRVTVHVGVKAQ